MKQTESEHKTNQNLWQSKSNIPICAIFLMDHFEYLIETLNKWKCQTAKRNWLGKDEAGTAHIPIPHFANKDKRILH